MKVCILCHKETSGSIGAAGIRWPNICQPCKDIEDKAALAQVKNQAALWDMIDARLYQK